jgi:hypothetical protein
MSDTTTPFPLGVYLDEPNPGDPPAEAQFEADYSSFVNLMGTTPSYINTYVDNTQPISSWAANASYQAWSNANSPDANGLTPVIALPMSSNAAGAGTPDQQYQAFASGQYDSALTGIVNAWAAQGFTSLVFRPGWEFNLPGPNYAGDSAQDQSDWVAAFQHIYTVLHQAGAADGVNINVVWNPGVTNYSNAEATTNMYPGNQYVDTIGADMYSDMYPYSDGPNSSGQPQYHDWDTGGEDTSVAQFIADPVNREHYWSYPAATEWSLDSSGGHSQSLDSLIQFAEQQGKPFAVPETGAGNSNSGTDVQDDAAFPQWLSQQLTAAQSNGLPIDFVDLWDSNGGGNYQFSYASDGKPQEAAAWAQYFGAQSSATDPALSGSNQTFTLGDGNFAVSLAANSTDDTISVGTGTDTLTTAAGDSHNTFQLNNSNSSLVLHGTGNVVFISGGNDTITDSPSGNDKLTLDVGSAGGQIELMNFSAAHGKIDLAPGLGFSTAAAAAGALQSDGAGGSVLLLNGQGLLDFQGVAPSSLHASNFHIG